MRPPIAGPEVRPGEGETEAGRRGDAGGDPSLVRVGVVLGGASVLVGAGAFAGDFADWPGVVHLVAVPPLDLYADARLLVARTPDTWLLVPMLALALTLRVGVWWLVLGPSRAAARAFAALYVASLPAALVAAALDAAGRAALYTQLVWAALGVTLLGAVLGWRAFARRVRRVPDDTGAALGVLGTYGALLVVLGWLVARDGGPAPWPLVPVSAAATGAVTVLLIRSRTPTGRWRRFRLVPAATIVLLGALVVSGLRVPTAGTAPARPRPGSVLLVAGTASATGSAALFHLDPRRLGYRCRQVWYFSYTGHRPGARLAGPVCAIRDHRRYRGPDTMAPLAELVDHLVVQARALPRPLVLVTHSQGAWIAHAALADGRLTGVSHLVMLGPFARSLQPYPPPGRSGPGAPAGHALRVLSRVGRAIGFTSFDPDRPLPASLQGTRDAVAHLLSRPRPPGVRALAVPAALDVPLVYADPWARYGVTRACPFPNTHGGLVTSPFVAARVAGWLDGRSSPPCRTGAWITGPLTAPFGAPAPRSGSGR
jgi:hypothetical protein